MVLSLPKSSGQDGPFWWLPRMSMFTLHLLVSQVLRSRSLMPESSERRSLIIFLLKLRPFFTVFYGCSCSPASLPPSFMTALRLLRLHKELPKPRMVWRPWPQSLVASSGFMKGEEAASLSNTSRATAVDFGMKLWTQLQRFVPMMATALGRRSTSTLFGSTTMAWCQSWSGSLTPRLPIAWRLVFLLSQELVWTCQIRYLLLSRSSRKWWCQVLRKVTTNLQLPFTSILGPSMCIANWKSCLAKRGAVRSDSWSTSVTRCVQGRCICLEFKKHTLPKEGLSLATTTFASLPARAMAPKTVTASYGSAKPSSGAMMIQIERRAMAISPFSPRSGIFC